MERLQVIKAGETSRRRSLSSGHNGGKSTRRVVESMRTKDGRNPFRLGMSLGLFTLAASLILAGCSGTASTTGGEGAAKPAEGAKAL